MPGPIFANILLADEINRTPPKTQAALLEAMQEQQVTVGGVRYPLEPPFFVLATQNPIEQEGTYPLPEAQLDRFMFNIVIDYPTAEEERRILARRRAAPRRACSRWRAATRSRARALLVREIAAAENVIDYAMRLVRATRPAGPASDAGAGAGASVGEVGRGAPRRPGADPRRQGAGARGRAAPPPRSTTCARWPRRCSGTACWSTSRRKPTESRPTMW